MTREIYLAAGCFWGAEHYLKKINGVTHTEVGFANGHTDNPTYKEVYTDTTGYAECVRVQYDAGRLPLAYLLRLYLRAIDPTSLNRQGEDEGTRYRTGIYYTDAADEPVARAVLDEAQRGYAEPLCVELLPLRNFYPADEYHQDYLDKNPTGYCHLPAELFAFAEQANRVSLDLCHATYGEVKDVTYDVAMLPWGATEPHGGHLPYLTDCILSHDVAVDAARLAWERAGVRTMVLPPVMLGSQNPGQRELPFCLHFRQQTQQAVLTDIVASLHQQGLRRLLIVNGHGGNTFKGFVRDLAADYPDMLILVSNWYAVLPAKDYFDRPGDHADELETSAMLHYHPELVRMDLAGEGHSHAFRPAGLRDGTAWLPRHWNLASDDTGIGDPRAATADKGLRHTRAVAERYATLLEDLARITSPEELYEKDC